MPITVQQVIDRGFGLSLFSRPELAQQQQAMLVRVVDRAQHVLFAFAARINPLYYARFVDVNLSADGWLVPDDCELLLGVEGRGAQTTPSITGAVHVVPYDDRTAFAGQPSVTRIGAALRPAGNAGDPTAGQLRLLVSTRPASLTALSATLDARFPEAYVGILEYEVAAFNALSDGGREGELQVMIAERNRLIALYEQHLEHFTAPDTRRLAEVRRLPTERREPLRGLVSA